MIKALSLYLNLYYIYFFRIFYLKYILEIIIYLLWDWGLGPIINPQIDIFIKFF